MSGKNKLQLNSKRALCLILVALLIIFGVFFLAGTSARYIGGDSADMNMPVAKWAVAMKNGDEPLAQSFSVYFTSKSNSHVASGKFAPSSEMQATFILDLADTDVAVDYNVTVDTRIIDVKLQSGDMTLTLFDNDSPKDMGCENCISLSDERTHTLELVLKWETNGNSVSDVDFALNNTALSLPVSIRVRQHIDDADGEIDGRKVSSAISYIQTTETKTRMTGKDILAEQDILSDNPESGFYSSSFLKLTESGTAASRSATSVKSDTSSMLYLKVDLSEFSGNMNASGEDIELSAAAIKALDDTLNIIKQNDNTVILRFVYDDSASGVIEGKDKVEPSQTMLLTHIGQLGGTFKKYSTTINVIQVGFYGLWGECYYNTDATATKKGPEYYPQTVNALLDATDGTEITVAVRTTQYYEWYKAGGVHTDDARVGIFNDAYGASADDLGTYNYKYENENITEAERREKGTAWLSEKAEKTYYGGEAIADSNYDSKTDEPSKAVGVYNAPEFFINEAYKLHTSYLNWEWNQALHKQWAKLPYAGDFENDNALAYIERHLGYRFFVKDVKTYKTVAGGEALPIDISICNTGFANLIKSKRCDIVLVNADGIVAAEFNGVNIDARMFISQATITQSVKINLPSTLAAGSYTVYLRMSSGETLDSGKYYSAVRFANEDMWNEGLQANYLAKIEVGVQ